MGIEQIGIRKKILDTIRDTHKKNWETSSLASLQYNKKIRYYSTIWYGTTSSTVQYNQYSTMYNVQSCSYGLVWTCDHCRISPSHFLAECRKRLLNHGSIVLLYFAFASVSCILFVFFPVLSVYQSSVWL